MDKKKEVFTKTVYIYDGKEFEADGMETDDVKTLLSATFPEIANSNTKTEIKDGVRRITFTKVAGTKGITSAEIAHKLVKLKEESFLGINILQCLLGKEKFDLDKQIGELEKIETKINNKIDSSSLLIRACEALEPISSFSEGI